MRVANLVGNIGTDDVAEYIAKIENEWRGVEGVLSVCDEPKSL